MNTKHLHSFTPDRIQRAKPAQIALMKEFIESENEFNESDNEIGEAPILELKKFSWGWGFTTTQTIADETTRWNWGFIRCPGCQNPIEDLDTNQVSFFCHHCYTEFIV